MTRRFLEYSLRYRRPIKAVWLEGDQIMTGSLTVTALRDDSFTYTAGRGKKTPREMPLGDLLSASYARGDDGDSMKNAERTQDETSD